MRKIELEMLQAINLKNNWSKDNTQVIFDNGTSKVYLHGHHIANINHLTGCKEANKETLKDWPTNTTKSRLRSLGLNVSTKKGVTYLNGEKL